MSTECYNSEKCPDEYIYEKLYTLMPFLSIETCILCIEIYL